MPLVYSHGSPSIDHFFLSLFLRVFLLSVFLLRINMSRLGVCLLLLCQGFLSVSAWGQVGHSLVARLAQSQLTPTTNRWINSYLSSNFENNLGGIASWPDVVLYPDTNPLDYQRWQWSRQLHYINTPPWNCEYVPARDCPHNRCIEGALKNYSRRLVDRNSDYGDQQEALFFLVHFLGDVHQPLHSGFANDEGGNSVKGRHMDSPAIENVDHRSLGFFLNGTSLTNLHSIWDVEIINARIRRHFQSNVNLYYEFLQTLMLNQSSVVNETFDDYQAWIQESVSYVCQQVYLDDNGDRLNVSANFTLGEAYFNRNWPLVDQRLAQGGRRLASLLNRLVNDRSPMKLPADIQALIVMLCLGAAIVITAATAMCLYFRRYPMVKEDVLLPE